ncbi:unnamed protein product [marine sediment metagenome]|uniref:Uncharacterized protein n=1 Tax=marine sediment metagenome TaxID=412755 RepID=X1D726_9ZZZZ
MTAENTEYEIQSIIVKPNLGHPLFLKIDPKLKTKEFETDIILISNIKDPKKLEENLKLKIKLEPLLDYTWKFRNEFKKKDLDFSADSEKKGFWARRKEKKIERKKLRIIR